MKIVTLIENMVSKSELVAEHGLSLYIETENKKIIFDTGQSGLFIHNAEKMGIDVRDVDYLILSHGHYDHTGGSKAFLELNSKAEVLANKEIFTPKYSGKTRFTGLIDDEKYRNRISFIKTNTILDHDLIIVPDIKIHHSADTNFRMFYKKIGNSFFPDDFEDELFLILKHHDKLTIITACSHRGITNICSSALELYDLPVHMITGGFHMKDCSEEQYSFIAQQLKKIKPEIVGVCHCTGVEKYADLKRDLDSKVFYNYTGNEITIR